MPLGYKPPLRLHGWAVRADAVEVRMTSRCGWLLLGIAVGIQCMPGCFPLRIRSDDTSSVRQTEVAPTDVAIGKSPPAEEPAVAKAGESAYPSVLEGPAPVASTAEPAPPASTVEPPVTRVIPDPQELVARAPTDPPATSSGPKPPVAEPPIKFAPLVLALQCVLDGRHQDAVKHLERYDPETQKFYLRCLPVLTIMARKRVDQLSVGEVALLNEQLQSMLLTLRPKTELVIDRMCYCEWVKSYGMYQPLPDNHAFLAPSGGRPGEMVSLYVEVRNVASVQRGNCFETRLSSTIEMRDARGQRVWPVLDFKDGEKPRRTLSRLNDYYNTLTFLVPPLPPGTYQLVLCITDETDRAARRVTHKTLEFRVSPLGSRGN